MNPLQSQLATIELVSGCLAGAAGVGLSGVLLIESSQSNSGASLAGELLIFAVLIAALSVSVGAWRHVMHHDRYWLRTMSLATLFILAMSFFLGPILLFCCMFSAIAVIAGTVRESRTQSR